MKIYVVSGYWAGADEHEEWIICAYVDEAKAKEHAANAKRRNEAMHDEQFPWHCNKCPKGVPAIGWLGNSIKIRCDNSHGFACPIKRPENEYDQNHRYNYDNEYQVEVVDLVEA